MVGSAVGLGLAGGFETGYFQTVDVQGVEGVQEVVVVEPAEQVDGVSDQFHRVALDRREVQVRTVDLGPAQFVQLETLVQLGLPTTHHSVVPPPHLVRHAHLRDVVHPLLLHDEFVFVAPRF